MVKKAKSKELSIAWHICGTAIITGFIWMNTFIHQHSFNGSWGNFEFFKCYDMKRYFELWQMHHEAHIKEMEKTYGRKYPQMINDLRAEEEALLDELYESHPEEKMPFN